MLTVWAARLANEVRRRLLTSLPELFRSSLASDPAVRQSLDGVLADAAHRLTIRFSRVLDQVVDAAWQDTSARMESRRTRARREMARNTARILSIVRRWTRRRSLTVWLPLVVMAAALFPAAVLMHRWDGQWRTAAKQESRWSEDRIMLVRDLARARLQITEMVAERQRREERLRLLDRLTVKEFADGRLGVRVVIPDSPEIRRAGIRPGAVMMQAAE